MKQADVKKLFDYRDGNLYWRVRPAPNVDITKPAGHNVPDEYRKIHIGDVTYRAHKLIWLYHYGVIPYCIDHKDNNGHNNNIENLRIATRSQNNANCGIAKNNKSGEKGVHFRKVDNKWCAQIKKDRVGYRLGIFKDKLEASLTYMFFAVHFYGEFARAQVGKPMTQEDEGVK